MRIGRGLLAVGFVMLFLALAAAQDSKLSGNRKLLESLQDEVDGDWYYDDLAAAQKAAKASGKPMLVTFRCVPCTACKAIDATVAKQADDELAAVMGEFVCVRLVQMNGVDLRQFQFDYGQSWSVMFMNADGTIYGRYGSRNDEYFESVKGLVAGMQEVLSLHKNYPDNKELFKGKQGAKTPWANHTEMSVLKNFPDHLETRQGRHGGCLHCHHVEEGTFLSKVKAQKVEDRDLWLYPMPDVLGLQMDVDSHAAVKAVVGRSVADKAGLTEGDVVQTMDGQAIVSVADMQWVLHHAPDEGRLKVSVLRDGGVKNMEIVLKKQWRRAEDFAWRPMGHMFQMRMVGASLSALGDEAREALGLGVGRMAIRVEWMAPNWLKEANQGAKKILKDGDVLVGVDGRNDPWTIGELLAYLAQHKTLGETVKLLRLRDGKTQEVTLHLPDDFEIQANLK